MELLKVEDFLKDTEYLILDVRSSDFKGGNIPGATNIPSTDYNQIKEFVGDKDKILVHCMFSSVRGPGVYHRLKRDYPSKNIKLLEGGFSRYFNLAIKKDKKLIENLDMSCWDLKLDGKKNVYKNKYE